MFWKFFHFKISIWLWRTKYINIMHWSSCSNFWKFQFCIINSLNVERKVTFYFYEHLENCNFYKNSICLRYAYKKGLCKAMNWESPPIILHIVLLRMFTTSSRTIQARIIEDISEKVISWTFELLLINEINMSISKLLHGIYVNKKIPHFLS